MLFPRHIGELFQPLCLGLQDAHSLFGYSVVPASLVIEFDNGAFLGFFDQSVRPVPVKTGPAYGPLIEVEGDLKAGQQVVTRGNERLRPGQAVQVIKKAGPRR